jgi:hypothetical protein
MHIFQVSSGPLSTGERLGLPDGVPSFDQLSQCNAVHWKRFTEVLDAYLQAGIVIPAVSVTIAREKVQWSEEGRQALQLLLALTAGGSSDPTLARLASFADAGACGLDLSYGSGYERSFDTCTL